MNAPLNPGRSSNAAQPKPSTRDITTTRTRSITGSRSPTSRISPGHQASPRGLELVSEVDDLAVGIGILTFALAPFALPGLALVALTMAVLMIPALGIALLLAPFLVARHCSRSRDRPSAANRLACLGEDDAGYEGVPHELVLRGRGV
jgi:hypothetical protein